jgi:hypothetical protein
VVYCVAFQATEGTILAFTWVHLGLIGCAVSGFSASKMGYGKGLDQIAAG